MRSRAVKRTQNKLYAFHIRHRETGRVHVMRLQFEQRMRHVQSFIDELPPMLEYIKHEPFDQNTK